MSRTPRFALKMPVVPEHDIQRSIVRVLRLELGREGAVNADGVLWFSVDHATSEWSVVGERSGRGVVPGIPDMVILWMGRAYWCELKTKAGALDGQQKPMMGSLIMAGCRVAVATDVDEFMRILDTWEIPRRRRVKLA